MSAGEPRRAAGAVHEQLSTGRRLLLLLDFDGTLCEFNPDPAAVRLPEHRRRLLLDLGQRRAITLGIVSGRRLDDVRERSGLPDSTFFAGLHGLEIEGAGVRFVHPDVERSETLLRQLWAVLSADISGMDGVFMEDKGLSLAVHYRDASPAAGDRVQSLVLSRAEPHIEARRIRVMHGSKVLELLPDIDWNKGSAVEWISRRVAAAHGDHFTVYAGDDVTDEDAFRAVKGRGLAIAASQRARGADVVLEGPPAVEEWLRSLLLQRAGG